MSLHILPPEMIHNISSYLFPFDVLRLSHTSQLLKVTLRNEVLKIKAGFEREKDPSWAEWSPTTSDFIFGEVNLSERVYLREFRIDSGLSDFFRDRAARDWIDAEARIYSSNRFVRLFELPLTVEETRVFGRRALTENVQSFACLMVSMQSVIHLEIILSDCEAHDFAIMLMRARKCTEYCFPNLKTLSMTQKMVYGYNDHSVYLKSAEVILAYFERCERFLEFILRPYRETFWMVLGKISMPGIEQANKPIQFEWDCRDHRSEVLVVMKLTRSCLGKTDRAQRWKIIESEAWQKETRNMFKGDSKIERLFMKTDGKREIFRTIVN